MRAENVAMSCIEERLKGVERALKGLVLYRQLRHEPAIQAFEQFLAGLISGNIPAERVWDSYNWFAHCMLNALLESCILSCDSCSFSENDGLTRNGVLSGYKGSATVTDDSFTEDSLENRPLHRTSCHDDGWQPSGGLLAVAGDVFWKAYWGYNILCHETVFSRCAEHTGFDGIPPWLQTAMQYELTHLKRIAMVKWDEILKLASYKTGIDGWLNIFISQNGCGEGGTLKHGLPACGGINQLVPYHEVVNWGVRELAQHFYRNGSGMFGIFKGFRWERMNGEGCLKGIANVDPVTLDQLVGYEDQKAKLIENTEQLLKGYRANNVLLYGDKGTGKSSLVKALVHRYAEEGLRIVEVPKDCLRDYYQILEQLEGRKQKFILFVDDLSFEESEVEYKHIKALLEGGLEAKPTNVVVYATSNRRHLVREFHHDRSSGYSNQEDEVLPIDSMQEKLSLSDRFGITLTFIAPSQKTYLEMVEHLADKRGISIDADTLREEALRWEKKYNGRSGRTARQFIDYLEAKLGDAAQSRKTTVKDSNG